MREVERLQERDREVRAHERAHMTAGGSYVRGGATFEYQRGRLSSVLTVPLRYLRPRIIYSVIFDRILFIASVQIMKVRPLLTYFRVIYLPLFPLPSLK